MSRMTLGRALRSCNLTLALLLAALFVGCSGGSENETAEGPAQHESVEGQSAGGKSAAAKSSDRPQAMRAASAEEILAAVGQAYGEADSYRDKGRVRLKLKFNGSPVDDTADFAVIFQRPNLLRLDCYQATVAIDGQQAVAVIADLEGQALEVDAPETLTLESVYGLDPVLSTVMTQGIAGALPQLSLLLDGDAISRLQEAGEGAPELLTPAAHDDRDCHRVQFNRPEGPLVFWIDQETYVVRRIDLTADPALFGEGVSDIELWAEFPGAELNTAVDDAVFEYSPPSDAKRVANFNPQLAAPAPPKPSELLGQPVDGFAFTTLDGGEITLADLKDKVVVLDFWATWCGPCVQSLPNLQQVYTKYKDHPQVAFLAVSLDQPDVADSALQDKFKELGVEVPIVRDPQQFARDTFRVEGIPNLMVIGRNGKLQDNEIGFNPELATTLPAVIDKLLRGEDTYPDVLQEYEEQLKEFEARQQAAANAPAPGTAPQASLAERSEPASLAMEKLWSNDKFEQPGNVLFYTDGDTPHLLVHEGWTKVVELDASGEQVAEHDLQLPDNSVISFLRTAVDGQGRRYFAGSASSQAQVHVFDAELKPVLHHPADSKLELSDVRLADLNGDGALEVIYSCWNADGIQAVSIDGKPAWQYDGAKNVLSLAMVQGEGNRQVLFTHEGGSVGLVNAAGEAGEPVNVQGRFVRLVAAADLDGDGTAELTGLAPGPAGNDVALGVSTEGKVLWESPLPPGIHERPIEMVTSGPFPGRDDDVWVVAGADGSLHFLTADGELVERFNYGEVVAGVALIAWEGQPTLVVATANKVEAWKLQAK